MEHHRAPGTAFGISPYASLSDAELRTAIRYTERLLRELEQDQLALRTAYRDEIETMRSHFIDRLLARVIPTDALITGEQKSRIEVLVGLQNIAATKFLRLVRCISGGRADTLEALTKTEAIGMLLFLYRRG